MSGNNIKVVCRFRPQNKRETAEGGVEIVRFDGNGQTVYFEVGSSFILKNLLLGDEGNISFYLIYRIMTASETMVICSR